MSFVITKLDPSEWTDYAEHAHAACFKEFRHASLDRISFALLAHDPHHKGPIGYVTVRELDSESCYWQHGGAFPPIEKTAHVLGVYQGFITWMREVGRFKRITTLVENTNVAYLKLAMHCGFRIIGVRMFKGEIFVEILKDFEGE